MTDILFKNARLIDPSRSRDEKGDLLVTAGRIAATGDSITAPKGAKTIDCRGHILCPGIVDMRAHNVDSAAAVKGGITTIILQPDQHTVIDTDAPVERIRHRAESRAQVRVYPMGTATKGMQGDQIAEIGQMLESGAVAFTDCRKPVRDAVVMRRLMEYAGYFDTLVVQFAEEASLAAGGFAHEGAIATRLGLNGIPAIAESLQIDRDAALCALTDSRLHISLLSSAAGVESVRQAKKRGIRITCSTAPQYLHLNDNAIEGYRTFAKFSPPLRSEEDRLALIAGLADGTIDTLVSDHDPKSQDVKRLPFAQAANGMVGFETLLALSLAPVHAGKVELMTALKALTSTPAHLLGLDAGTLETGAPADLMIFDMGKPWRIDTAGFETAAKNSPFDTLPVQGKVWKTIVGGTVVFD